MLTNVPRVLVAALAGVLLLAAAATATAQLLPTSPRTVTVALGSGDARIDGADGLLAGATKLVLENPGKRPADVLAFRLPAGGDVAAFAAKIAKLRDPSALMPDGSYVAFGSVAPGGSYTTTIDARPGRYVLAQLAKAPRVIGSFDVGEGTTGASAPEPDATFRLREYGIAGPRAISGTSTVRVQNVGDELHELVAARLAPGQSVNDALRLLKAGKEKQVKLAGPPGLLVGLVSPETTNDVELSLPKGRYALVCFYADRQSKGRPHIALGMGAGIKVR